MKFFECEGISRRAIQGVFILKILFGILLYLVYTFYYTDRSTADIYKYFDDSKVMFDSLFINPKDYFQMLLGIHNDTPYFDTYYNQMNHWYREYDSNLYNDSHTIIRFNAVIRLFSMGVYNVHTVFMCFLSLLGLTAIYKTFITVMKEKSLLLYGAVFLIPSVLFWGSGVLKEGLLFFGLGFLVYYSHKVISGDWNLKSIFWILFSIALLALTKFYVAIAVIPALVANYWIEKTGNRNVLLKYIASYLLLFSIGLFATNSLQVLVQKQKDFINLANGGTYLQRITAEKTDTIYIASGLHEQLEINRKTKEVEITGKIDYCRVWTNGKLGEETEFVGAKNFKETEYLLLLDYGKTGSTIEIQKLEPNILSFLKATPKALYNTYFRPFFFESFSPFILMAGFENLFIILLTIVAIIFADKKILTEKLFWLCVFFTIVIFALTGLITPVIGAIVRYKIAALPLLLIALFMLVDKNKLTDKLPFLKRF
ncbi:MAG: hypothetical protein POELPBGB_00713 [Bacteroidia bacterium]|nr:hypothetical protein [Bacteroidia bacterium]